MLLPQKYVYSQELQIVAVLSEAYQRYRYVYIRHEVLLPGNVITHPLQGSFTPLWWPHYVGLPHGMLYHIAIQWH